MEVSIIWTAASWAAASESIIRLEPPANEAVVASSVRAKRFRQIAPGGPGSQDPENTVKDTTVIHPRNATRLVRQHWLDGTPFMIGEFLAHDSRPPVWEFESQASGHAQCFGPASALSGSGERQPVAPLAESIKMTHRGSFLRIRFRRHHSLLGCVESLDIHSGRSGLSARGRTNW